MNEKLPESAPGNLRQVMNEYLAEGTKNIQEV